MPMRYVLGLDGGGTKTECVVAREDGTILARGRGRGVNRNFIDEQGFERSVHDALRGALDTVSEVRQLAYVVGTMSCDGRSMREVAQAYALPAGAMRWAGEASPARAASQIAYSRTPHLVVVAGTGSLVAGWDAADRPTVVGGAGSVVGDEGSAYWIGVRALIRLVEAFDGRRPIDAFARELSAALALPNKRSLIDRVYGGGTHPMTRDEIAAVAPHVSLLANAGDPVAIGLFAAAARELAFQANAVIRMLSLCNEPVLIQLYGGCFRAGAVIVDPLRQGIVDYASQAELLPALKCTVISTTALALQAIGVDVSAPPVRQRLLEGGHHYDLL